MVLKVFILNLQSWFCSSYYFLLTLLGFPQLGMPLALGGHRFPSSLMPSLHAPAGFGGGLQGFRPVHAELGHARLSKNDRVSRLNGKLGLTGSFFRNMYRALLYVQCPAAKDSTANGPGEITARCVVSAGEAPGEEAPAGKAVGDSCSNLAKT